MGCLSSKQDDFPDLEMGIKPEKDISVAIPIDINMVKRDTNLDMGERKKTPASHGYESTANINYNVRSPHAPIYSVAYVIPRSIKESLAYKRVLPNAIKTNISPDSTNITPTSPAVITSDKSIGSKSEPPNW